MTIANRVAARYAAAIAVKKDKPPAELIAKAMKMGEDAFKEGKKAVPAHDAEFHKLLIESTKGHPMGWSLPLLDAWSKGWMKENLAAPID